MKRQDEAGPSGRVTVLRGTRLVPLLDGSQDGMARRRQPWKGVVLERHMVRPGEIPEHEHPTLCLHLQLTGGADFEWWQDGKNAVERTEPGSLIVIPPGTRDRLRWQGSSERLILSIESEGLAEIAGQLGTRDVPEIRGTWSGQDAGLRLLLAEMGREAGESWPLGALYADLLALGLQSNLLRNHATQPMALPGPKGGMSLARLRRAMEYMSAHLAEDIGLEAIAAAMGVSASHFAHEFRSSTGATPYQYLLQQRLERAKSLLRTTRLPVQNVGALTGFPYAANFVRAFRQRFGVTPEVWRREFGL
ncbi:transcriptional regulator containing an amidase domain and an AraC-type DNA-binding HTH domain [Terriglobus roseus DSM 18391]|uniref:Transcriptional regulator containing an amidase domain and an AraC-type DNA-binding HTH domain n=2 Tax=Terriglobus roseus TaxID=392734 RepID=I3ZJV6_TERRK|nr:transcriptional regulator containing an amidase domain and an AraC-type DNA-binding HTH domain [Terriglobus roseus DSM 18391]